MSDILNDNDDTTQNKEREEAKIPDNQDFIMYWWAKRKEKKLAEAVVVEAVESKPEEPKPETKQDKRPPNLRWPNSCEQCDFFKDIGLSKGTCQKYDYAVEGSQVCDAFKYTV